MQISKTDFIQFLNCPNSLWLLKHKPDLYPHGEFSDFSKKIAAEGYEVEEYVKNRFDVQTDADSYDYQKVFQTDRGLYAKADVVRDNGDGTINLYEVKSSTRVKTDALHNQIKDATFQKITAVEAGVSVKKVFVIHLNGNYVRSGNVDTQQLLTFTDITSQVGEIEEEVRFEIDRAIETLAPSEIDESSCTCLGLTKSNHCDTFSYFNPNIPKPSIYNLPRISKAKIQGFANDGRFELDDIGVDEVTAKQAPVLRSAQQKAPVIDTTIMADFFAKATYPIYFLDYETYASAIPVIDDARPQAPIPFQYSLHVKPMPNDTELLHFEYLAVSAQMPKEMIEHMQNHIGSEGSIVSWHASFENTQNRTMATQYPDKADFLNDLISRTLDLEDLFKAGYVDIAFEGSTSIKKVLPVLASDLNYAGMNVASGTDAMEAWKRLIALPDGKDKDQLREAMLKYCKLDTYAMVRIFEEMVRKFEGPKKR